MPNCGVVWCKNYSATGFGIMRIIDNILRLLAPPLLLLLAAATCAAGTVSSGAADAHSARSDTTRKSRQKVSYIYFHINEAYLDQAYRGNLKTVEELRSLIDSVGHSSILGISASSFASPDGPFRKNLILADKRAAAMEDLFRSVVPEASHLITHGERGESWKRFRELVTRDTVLTAPQRDRILEIIDSDLPEDEKERLIKKAEPYLYVRDCLWPVLRYSCITIEYPLPYRIEKIKMLGTGAVAQSTLPMPARYIPEPEFTQRELFYLRTNLLVPLSNFGIEYCIGNNWSVGADYYFPWIFRNPDHRNCFQLLGGGIEGRYWFGNSRIEEDRLEGHSVGVSLSGGYYDFERGYTGNQGEFVNIGVDYLYSLPIFKDRLHLEFTVGLGYIYSYVKPYDVFEPGGKAFKRGYTQNFNWIGPSKAGVSLVVPIRSKRRECR